MALTLAPGAVLPEEKPPAAEVAPTGLERFTTRGRRYRESMLASAAPTKKPNILEKLGAGKATLGG